VAKIIYDRLGGSLEPTLDVCSLVAAQWQRGDQLSEQRSSVNLAQFVSREFQDKTKDFFLSLIEAIIEEEWVIDCYQVTAKLPEEEESSNLGNHIASQTESGNITDNEDAEEKAMADEEIADLWVDETLNSDIVYLELQNTLKYILRPPKTVHRFAQLAAIERKRMLSTSKRLSWEELCLGST
jgi:hypothetical protein